MGTQWTEEGARLRKLYADMGDGQLEALAGEAFALTDTARQVLQDELDRRKMRVTLRDAPVPKNVFNLTDSELVVFRQVKAKEEAQWLKRILENAGVACCFGPDNLYDLDDFRSSFEAGVDLKIVERDLQRAAWATRGLLPPESEDDPGDASGGLAYDARCPKCGSPDIVFEGLDEEDVAEPVPDSKFNWICDACGHQWSDDGIEHS